MKLEYEVVDIMNDSIILVIFIGDQEFKQELTGMPINSVNAFITKVESYVLEYYNSITQKPTKEEPIAMSDGVKELIGQLRVMEVA